VPAITPADATILHRVDAAEDAATRAVIEIADAPSFLEGEGFKVRRATAGLDLSWADPFLMLDHMGAVEYAPGEAKGAPDHPHRGFETVTYMLDGRFGTSTHTVAAA
jgi:redox-sensitive bicupin YhaK (pirin superfamily)